MNRVEELLRSMTWDEKLAQMQVVFRAGSGRARPVGPGGRRSDLLAHTLHATSELTLEIV